MKHVHILTLPPPSLPNILKQSRILKKYHNIQNVQNNSLKKKMVQADVELTLSVQQQH